MNNTTKTAQFTPGPWVVEEGWNGPRPTITAKISQTQVIDYRGLVADLEKTAFAEQAQANAQLIAAAPAMYEALQIMVRAANVDEIDPLVMFASIERARHVLKLAEGKSA